jgi:CcmD family protein
MHIGNKIRMGAGSVIFLAFLGASSTSVPAPEANLPFLFAAFAIAWLGFIIYAWYLASQHSQLRKEIANLQIQLTDIQNSVNNQ